jgi:hypothetical protein
VMAQKQVKSTKLNDHDRILLLSIVSRPDPI